MATFEKLLLKLFEKGKAGNPSCLLIASSRLGSRCFRSSLSRPNKFRNNVSSKPFLEVYTRSFFFRNIRISRAREDKENSKKKYDFTEQASVFLSLSLLGFLKLAQYFMSYIDMSYVLFDISIDLNWTIDAVSFHFSILSEIYSLLPQNPKSS